MSVTLQNPYARIPGRNYRWLKGNLHHHSTRSDGSRTPQGAVDRYAGLGYSVLAITDHDVFSDYTGVDPKGMILLPGVEHSTENVTLANGVPTLGSHVLQIGGTAFKGAGEQQVIDQINAVGGLAVLNHPGATSTFEHFPMEVILGLSGYIGLEVFNGARVDSDGSAFAFDKWDRLLSTGRIVWGFANDDNHHPIHDARGWNMIQIAPDQANPQGVIAALRAGSFYVSTGVTIDAIETCGAELYIKSPDAEAIEIYGKNGVRCGFAEGGEIRFDAAEISTPFIRAQLYGYGIRMAWTQPFVIAK